jgi:hypothetical protein
MNRMYYVFKMLRILLLLIVLLIAMLPTTATGREPQSDTATTRSTMQRIVSTPSPSLEVYVDSERPTGADIAAVYGEPQELTLIFWENIGGIHITDIVSDNPEWIALNTDFTVDINHWAYVLFTPSSDIGVSVATFTVYSDAPDSPHRFTVSGARVAQIRPTTTSVLSVTSIELPNRLRINPVKNELYAQGFPGSGDENPEGKWLVRLDTVTRQENGALQFPLKIRDHGVTQDGRWLYAATDFALYTVDLNTFQITDTFIPPQVEPANATLCNIGVFSGTLVFVSTNPHYASAGPIYQWNPQTGEWSLAPFCPRGGDISPLRVSANYSTIAGLCDPYYSSTTSFLYRLGETVETWETNEKWRAAVSLDGEWAVAYGWGRFMTMHRGDSGNMYMDTADSICYSMAFSADPLVYCSTGASLQDGSVLVDEFDPVRAIQTRRIAIRHSKKYGHISDDDGLVVKDGLLYVVLWDSTGLEFVDGEIVAVQIAPFDYHDTSPPSSRVTNLPRWSDRTFTVQWSGSDSGLAGLYSYDVQYRDDSTGVWTDWLTNTIQASSVFTGEYGHTYYFRCRARDHADNLEPFPSGDGDAYTSVYRYALSGNVLGNRDQPIALATVQAVPSAMNSSLSGAQGNFCLYFDQADVHDVQVVHEEFGSLPPMENILVTDTTDLLTFYLPPADDYVLNGNFESETPVAWKFYGGITPTITTTAHTGGSAALLGAPISLKTPGSSSWKSTVEQEVVISPTMSSSATLSLLYQVVVTEPTTSTLITDTLLVSLFGPTQSMTYTLPLTATEWTHRWWRVPIWDTLTMTLRLELAQSENKERTVSILLDDVSLGSSVRGSYPVFFPLVFRNKP